MPDNTDFEDLYLQSEQAIREGDLIRAKQLIEQMLLEDPRSAIAHNSMGWFYRVQFEDYRKAEQHYRTALRNNPNYPHAYWNYAYMLMDLERFEDLERLLEQGMERPAIQKTLIFNQLGEMREVQGRFDEALWAYQQAIRRSTKSDQIENLWDAIERVEEKVALDLHMQQWEAGNPELSPSGEGASGSAADQPSDPSTDPDPGPGLGRDQDRKERGLRNQLRQWRDAVQGQAPEGERPTAPQGGSARSPQGPGKELGGLEGFDGESASELEQFLRGDWFKSDGDSPTPPRGGARGSSPGSPADRGPGSTRPRKPGGPTDGPTDGSSDGPSDGFGSDGNADPNGEHPEDPER